jgi:hypothetical protein
VRRVAARIGYFRVAALFVLGALVCDAVSRQAFAAGSAAAVLLRVASIAFFVCGLVPFVLALRERRNAGPGA